MATSIPIDDPTSHILQTTTRGTLSRMKLVSLNVEGNNHFKRVHSFLRNEQPDTLCLQEAPEYYTETLRALGYTTAFAPVCRETRNGETYNCGLLVGSRLPMTASEQYYVGSRDIITVHRPDIGSVANDVRPYLKATVTDTDGTTYTVATTHLIVTPNGHETETQVQHATALLALLKDEPPHVLCGDFNMPRGYNILYDRFTKRYTDTVPSSYTSSLDRTLHKSAHDPNLNAPIFDIYMVDYIFTEPPYTAHDVRLEFGISDHAAVIGEIVYDRT